VSNLTDNVIPFPVNVTVNSTNDPSKIGYVNTLTTVSSAAVNGTDLTNITALSGSVEAGINMTYYLHLQNTGTLTDNYTIIVDNPNGASIAYTNLTSIMLGSGAEKVFLLNVSNTTANAIPFPVNVTVNSTNDPTKIGYINTSTTVTPPAVKGVTLTNISALENTTTTGVNRTYRLNLTNTGTATDTYTITIDPGTAIAAVDLTSVPLVAGASQILALNVTNATADIVYVNVTATSTDVSKNASISTTTYVHSLPPEMVTSYWGTVKILGNATANAVVRISGADTLELANTTSNSNGLYLIQVAWDDLSTPGIDEGVVTGENLTFKVNGTIAGTTIVGAKGTNTHLNLTVADNVPPVITITFPVNDTNISIFDRVIIGNITDDSALSSANLIVENDLKKTWTTKGIFRVLNNFTQGLKNITITAKDQYDNYNQSSTFATVLPPTFVGVVNVGAGNSTTLTANAYTGVDLDVWAAGNSAVAGTILINASINAGDFNASTIAAGLDRYVDINATNLTGNLSSVNLTMYYSDYDLDKNLNGVVDGGDINEATLSVFWYWDNATGAQVWWPLASGTDLSAKLDKAGNPGPIVSKVSKNTTGNYITVTMNHFSIYTIAGTVIPTPPPGCTVNCGGSGGGGGGGMSGENYTNIDVIEKYDMQISKDALTSYKFVHAKNPIIYVNITGNTSLGIITASIEVLKGTSTLVKNPPEGLVYKNANIWVGTTGFATPKNIKDAFIKFKIDNAWMSANGVSAGDIVLMKWDGTSWIKLETKVLTKDDTNSYFEGWTNSFSPFAIVAKTQAGPTPTVTTPTPAGTPKTTATATPKPITKGGGISYWIIGLIILVIIGAGAYYFVVVKKEK
ncbi:MAG: PGF-pre-PGF domain-containing protein, partial [Candidatus Methanoperedens sp.]|nr:PGF-pre-PGF domain-containing protein [Candidatus Methanoperedens sp.]